MKNKTILMVLDGLDFSYIVKNIESFTLFKEWYEKGQLHALESVVPADSIPSWITIYTGMNPAEHGVLETIDYLNKKQQIQGQSAVIKGKSFWDKIGSKGKRVFIFNPFIASPAWDVNGVMVCRSTLEEKNELTTNRPDIVDLSVLDLGGTLKNNPTMKELPHFLEETWKMTDSQFDNFHKYFKGGNFDLGFLGVTTPDRLQHITWKYTDPEDRCFPKNNSFQNVIKEGYKYFEKQVQKMVDLYSEEYNIIVISDHGHGRRCQKVFYINQWLIQNGFIKNKSKKKRAVEYAKNATLTFLARIHCVQKGSNFFKKFKFAHKVKNAEHVFKNKGTIYAPNFDGVNPFGGIAVKRSGFDSDEEYEAKRQEIIDKLLQVKHNGKPIMLWVKRREDIYNGVKVENYPEIVYRMDNDYGVDRGIYGKRIFGISPFHEIISGGHRFEGVIMSTDGSIIKDVDSVLKIHNTMCNLF